MHKGRISEPREMFISFLSFSGWEGPSKLQGGGICVESLVDMIGLISVHSTAYNKRGVRYISPVSVINQVSLSGGSKSKQSKHSDKNIFRILRHSLLRNQIFCLISKGFYLSPSREIMEEEQPHIQGAMASRAPEGLEELFHVQGREGRWWGDSPRPR